LSYVVVAVVSVGLGGVGGSKEESELCDDVGLPQGKLPVDDIEEFPFNATDITFAEQSGPSCPIGVLRRCVIDILKE
jgi:hypothetical protein